MVVARHANTPNGEFWYVEIYSMPGKGFLRVTLTSHFGEIVVVDLVELVVSTDVNYAGLNSSIGGLFPMGLDRCRCLWRLLSHYMLSYGARMRVTVACICIYTYQVCDCGLGRSHKLVIEILS